MSLRHICIEVRKNLRCANVFLQFDQSLTEMEFLKINVDKDAIRLREYSTETKVDLSAFFDIDVHSMSNLTVDDCNASFRLGIDSIKQQEDLLQAKGIKYSTMLKSILTPVPQLKEGDDTVAFHCNNCQLALSELNCYKRIREYPSGSIDMGEFFCHHGPDLTKALVPRCTDLYYGFYYIVLNVDIMQASTKARDQHLYCQRCLQFLGTTINGDKAVKLWTDTLRLKRADAQLCEIFAMPATTTKVIWKLINDAILDCSPLQFTRVLLEATFSNRQRKFLLIHILEKQLRVVRNHEPIVHTECNNNNNNNAFHVQLIADKCCKLMFRLMMAADEAGNMPTLLTHWQKDISIHSLRISPSMFSALLHEVEVNAKLLPERYRYVPEGFCLSYIFYDKLSYQS